MICHRAYTLRDTAYALIKAEMDTDFEEQCQEISRSRKERKEKTVDPSDVAVAVAATAAATTTEPSSASASVSNDVTVFY